MELGTSAMCVNSGVFRYRCIDGTFSSEKGGGIVLSGFCCGFTQFRGVNVMNGGNAKGSAFVGVLLNRIRPSDNGFSVNRAIHFNCFSRRKLGFERSRGIVSIVARVTSCVSLNGNGRVATSRFLRFFLFAPRRRRGCMCGLDNNRGHGLCLYAILVEGPGFLILSRPAGSLSVRALRMLRRCLRSFTKYMVIIDRSHCFVSGIMSRLLMFGNRNRVRSFPNGCARCES